MTWTEQTMRVLFQNQPDEIRIVPRSPIRFKNTCTPRLKTPNDTTANQQVLFYEKRKGVKVAWMQCIGYKSAKT